MIWGMTKDERNTWRPVFAWHPVRLIDKRWAWLQRVERISYFAPCVDANVPNTIFGAWSFREPENG